VYCVISMVECEWIGTRRFVVLVLDRLQAEGLEVADLGGHAALQVVNDGREG